MAPDVKKLKGASGTPKTTPTIRKDATDSMEMSPIVLPSGNGIVAIGDLWNCRTNTVEGNLFDGTLPKECLQADPIQTLKYKFHSCSESKDVVDIMSISASLSVDYVAGNLDISVSGKGSYEKTDTSTFREETVAVSYDAVTYQVRALPSAADKVSERMMALLKPDDSGVPKVAATHFVQAVLCGGRATGAISYYEKVDDSSLDISGSFKLSVKVGDVNVDAQAEFSMLDSELSEKYETTVSVDAQPRFDKSPTCIQHMFEQVESLDKLIDRERHFPELDKLDPNDTVNKYVMRVTGVPIEFKLVPIAHIMPIEIDEKYKLLEPETLQEYLDMCCTLRDYTNTEHIKRKLMEKEPRIIPLLMDDYNPLTAEIHAYATGKAKAALSMKQRAGRIFSEYKTDEQKKKDIEDLLQEFEVEFFEVDMENTFREFLRKAKQELADVRASDVSGIVDEDGEPAMRFFSNSVDLDDWYNGERTIKLLLRTDQKTERSPVGVFMKLYDLAPTLKKCGVEVGVAFPSISGGKFSLTYKSSEYETEYPRDEIRYFIEVLSVAVDEGDTIPKLFYSLNAALSGLHLPMIDYLFDVPNLAIVMKEYKDTVICETYCELLAKLFETLDQWNFVFPIEGLNSSIEMMRFYRQMRIYIPEKYPNLRHKFYVSRFNNVDTKFNAPLLLLFYENRFQAVCLDHLDILIMVEELAQEEPDFQLLSFGRLRESCLYPARADWAVTVIQNLSLEHETFKTDPIPELDEFPDNPDKFLMEAIRMTRAGAIRDEPTVLTTAAKLALQDPEIEDDLEAVLASYGWKDGEFSRSLWNSGSIEWPDFLQAMKDFLAAQAPHLMKVILALEELKELGPPEDVEWTEDQWNTEVNNIVNFIRNDTLTRGFSRTYMWKGKLMNEDDLYENLKQQVKTYDELPGKVRRIGISKLFESYITKESSRPEIFHIFILTSFVEGMADGAFNSLKQLIFPVCVRYCERLEMDWNLYPRGQRRLQDYLTEKQLFKVLGVLGEVSFHPNLYIIHQEFFNISTLPAPMNMKSLIEKMSNSDLGFDINQCEAVWTNPKFLRALRQVIDNEGVLDALIVHVHELAEMTRTYLLRQKELGLISFEEEEKDEGYAGYVEGEALPLEDCPEGDDCMPEFRWFIPTDIAEKIRALIVVRRRPTYDYPKEWTTVREMIEAFQIIEAKNFLPSDFGSVLRENVERGGVAEEALDRAGALRNWNEEDKVFEYPWSWEHVKMYLKLVMEEEISRRKGVAKNNLELCPNRKFLVKGKLVELPKGAKVNYLWEKFVKGAYLSGIPFKEFSKLDFPQEVPQTLYDRLPESVPLSLRFLKQSLLMGNTSSLWAANAGTLVKYPPLTAGPGQIDFGDGIPEVGGLGAFLSRGDLLTALFNLTDSVASYHILRALARRDGVPLPLIVTSIEETPGTPKDVIPTKAVFLAELLKDLIIPGAEDLAIEPRLFRTPYRFVLTLRIGDVLGQDENGRSSLINSHVMKKGDYFASRQDPGSVNGKPLNRNGFLEFSWLTETNCDPVFWSNFVEKLGQNELFLLGLLHGDSLNLGSIFEVILPYVSCFVVFWKASNFNELKTKRANLTKLVGTKRRMLDMVLYPDSSIAEKVPDRNLIFKEVEGSAHGIINKNKIQNVIYEALKFSVQGTDGLPPPPVEAKAPSLFASLSGPKGAKPLSTTLPITTRVMDPISTPESNELLAFIRATTIGDIQDAISSNDANIISQLSALFSALLNSSGRERGLTHFLFELDRLSRKNSLSFTQRMQKVRAQIANKFVSPANALADTNWIKETQEEVRLSMALLRRNTLNLHDLWRTTWNHIQTTGEEELAGDHIMSGFPIEMYHPSHGSYLWANGVKEVVELAIPKDTNIFVISSFGLKKSGKSSLLNALFGSSFTEHSTTFGLQLKLCFLQDELKEMLDCDAFLVIDSEGFGAMENRIDDEADAQERALLAFLLSVSGLSLATVMGRRMGELEDIIDLSMFSLSKLQERKGVQPADILLVQNFLEEQPDDNVLATEFDRSLSSAAKASNKFLLSAGLRMTEAHRLKQVKSRNKHDEVLFKVRDWGKEDEYCEDVLAIYRKIIEIAAISRGVRTTFGAWFGLTTQVWEEINAIRSSENEKLLRAKNSSTFADAVTQEEKIANLKKVIDSAFAYHEGKNLRKLLSEIDQLFMEYKPSLDAKIKSVLNNKIWKELLTIISACEDQKTNPIGGGRRKAKMITAGEVNPNACLYCAEAFPLREALYAELAQMPKGFLTIEALDRYLTNKRDNIYERIRQACIARQLATRQSDGDLEKKLDEIIEEHPSKIEQYKHFLQYVSTQQYLIPATYLCYSELLDVYKTLPHVLEQIQPEPAENRAEPLLSEDIITFDVSIYNSALESAMNPKKEDKMSWLQHDWLVARMKEIPKTMKDDFEAELYKMGMVADLQARIQSLLGLFQEYCGGENLMPDFRWEAHVFGIKLFMKYILEQQERWDLKVRNEDDPEKKGMGGNPLKVMREMEEVFMNETTFFLPTNSE